MYPLISVIVPIYNVEKYLARCVDSILGQTYDNIEIILVNDGSTDDCGDICDYYAQHHSNVRVIHQVNGGLSAARNSGIDVAKGEFLAFVDSDDWILPSHIYELYDSLSKTGLDLAICQNQKVKSEEDVCYDESHTISVLEKETVMRTALSEYKWWSACDKLFKKSLFDKLRFPVGRINEDFAIIFYIFHQCASIAVGSQATYCYYERMGSITKSGFNKNKLTEYTNAVEVYEFIEKNYPALAVPAEGILITVCLKLLSALVLTEDKNREYDEWKSRLRATIRESFPYWIKNPYILWKQKILLLTTIMNLNLFKIIENYCINNFK